MQVLNQTDFDRVGLFILYKLQFIELRRIFLKILFVILIYHIDFNWDFLFTMDFFW